MSPTQSEVTESERRLDLGEVLDWLVADALVGAQEAAALRHAKRYYRGEAHPLVLVAEQKWRSARAPHKTLTVDALCEWLAGRVGLEYRHIDPLRIDFSAVTEVMSNAYAARFRLLPLEVGAREVVVACAEPFIREWERELRPILGKEIRRVIANPIDIGRYLAEFYNLARSVKKAMAAGEAGGAGLSNFEQLVEMGRANRPVDANDQHIVHIVDWLWQYAFEQRASDIHLEPRRELGLVRFRIDGVLHQVYQIPAPIMNAMMSRIKILGRMDVVEKRRPQDGRIKTRTPEGEEVELRLSTLPTAFGEKMVMRIFDPEVLVRDFGELGFSEEDRARWAEMTARPSGIILVTGPTGSGKTTTLYSTLRHLATPEVNVCTIEDPIEMIEPAFNQVQVQHSIEMGFAQGVRSLMRQDPDIIMVGEIRDFETADMAIQAALTGHLVLSTLHTNDAPSAVTRLLDLGAPSYLLNATLIGVMAQRLVRTLCPHCKREFVPGEEERSAWTQLTAPWKAPLPAKLHAAEGCLECRMTGYLGRIGIYEILPMSAQIRSLITRSTDLAQVREAAHRQAMKPLRVSGAMKIAAGLTTLDEVRRVAPPREDA